MSDNPIPKNVKHMHVNVNTAVSIRLFKQHPLLFGNIITYRLTKDTKIVPMDSIIVAN